MKSRNADLHGSAPDSSPLVLLLIDVINDLEFPEGPLIEQAALRMAERVAELKARSRRLGIPVIYVNDNFGRWQSDFRRQVEHCLREGMRGREVARRLRPEEEDYFVLKPKHSGFFSTTLDLLLEYLQAERLILTGIAGNLCVLYTANDAYMRDYDLIVPSDCVASNTAEDNAYALRQMEQFLKADVRPSAELDLERLVQRKPGADSR